MDSSSFAFGFPMVGCGMTQPSPEHDRREDSGVRIITPNEQRQGQEKATMEAVQGLPPHQQQAFMKNLEEMQMKDSLT